MIPPTDVGGGFRQRNAPQHNSPMFKIFSPNDMHEWNREHSHQNHFQQFPNQQTNDTPQMKSRRGTSRFTRPICKYLIYAILLILFIGFLVIGYIKFFSRSKPLPSNPGIQKVTQLNIPSNTQLPNELNKPTQPNIVSNTINQPPPSQKPQPKPPQRPQAQNIPDDNLSWSEKENEQQRNRMHQPPIQQPPMQQPPMQQPPVQQPPIQQMQQPPVNMQQPPMQQPPVQQPSVNMQHPPMQQPPVQQPPMQQPPAQQPPVNMQQPPMQQPPVQQPPVQQPSVQQPPMQQPPVQQMQQPPVNMQQPPMQQPPMQQPPVQQPPVQQPPMQQPPVNIQQPQMQQPPMQQPPAQQPPVNMQQPPVQQPPIQQPPVQQPPLQNAVENGQPASQQNVPNSIPFQITPFNASINEYPQQALHQILESVLYATDRPKDLTLFHLSSHFDFEAPHFLHGSYLKSWKKFSSHVSSRAYLMPLVYLGIVKKIIWVRPSWGKSPLKDGQIYRFTIGNVGDSERLAIDNIELAKAGILTSGYAPNEHLTNKRVGELIVVDAEYLAQSARVHSDSFIGNLLGISPGDRISWNIDASFFTARNPFLNWLDAEDASRNNQFNIHAAVSIFNPQSYCMDQTPGEQARIEFTNAFRAFYRAFERHSLETGAFLRLKSAITPFWCNQLKLGYSLKSFHTLIHTVLEDDELKNDPDLHNIVDRLKELNVYPHHVSTDQHRQVLSDATEYLINSVTNLSRRNPFSVTVVLSAKERLVSPEEKTSLSSHLQTMISRLFRNPRFVSEPENQVYPHSISQHELQMTHKDDMDKIRYFEMNYGNIKKQRKPQNTQEDVERATVSKLRKQREMLRRQMQENSRHNGQVTIDEDIFEDM